MSDLLGPDGGRARKEDQVSVTIDEVELPLPDQMASLDAAKFQRLFCIGQQQTPLGPIRAPMMTPFALLVAIETKNALDKRDEKIEAMEKVIDDLHAEIEGLAMRISEIEAEGSEE